MKQLFRKEIYATKGINYFCKIYKIPSQDQWKVILSTWRMLISELLGTDFKQFEIQMFCSPITVIESFLHCDEDLGSFFRL